MTHDGIEESNPTRQAGTIRRRIGLGIAMSGVLAVVAGGVFVGVTNTRAAADDARSMDAVAEAAASLDELPPVEPVVPADPMQDGAPTSPAAGVDYSKTPEGWFDATTDPADVVIPPTDDRGEPSTGIWEKQRQITARCMADQGFWYAWTNDRSKLADPTSGMILSDEDEAARLALWGTNPDDQPYDWRLGGCDAYAVHTTGMDDAH